MGAAATKESKHYAAFEAALPSLVGKTVAITGCTTGTGLVAAVCAARKGADHILLLNRVSDRSAEAEATVQRAVLEQSSNSNTTIVETIPCDLQDFASVRAAADAIKKKCAKLDVLCNNAGVMALDDVATPADGYDVQMQTNHLSHFLLTKELYPLLQAAAAASNTRKSDDGTATGGGGDARIVQHSSMARSGGPLKREYFGKNGGNLGGNGNSMLFNGAKWERYHQTKLANACFTAALAAKLEPSADAAAADADENNKKSSTKIKAVCAAPGFAQTNLAVTTNKTGGMGRMGMGFMYFSQSGEDGAIPLLTACFGPETVNGDFFEPKNGICGLPVKVGYGKHAGNADQQKMLWEASEEACGNFDV